MLSTPFQAAGFIPGREGESPPSGTPILVCKGMTDPESGTLVRDFAPSPLPGQARGNDRELSGNGVRRRTFIAIFVLLCLGRPVAAANIPLHKMNFVTGVSVSDQGDFTLVKVSMKMRRDLGVVKPIINVGGNTISFHLRDTFVDPPKKTFARPKDQVVRQVSGFQFDRGTVILKLVVKGSFELKESRIEVEVLDDRLNIRLWNKDPVAPEGVTVDAEMVDAWEREKGESSEKSERSFVEPPIDLSKIFESIERDLRESPGDLSAKIGDAKKKVAEPPETSSSLRLGEGLPNLGMNLVKMVSALIGVVGLIFLLAALARKYGKGRAPLMESAKRPAVRLISSTSIGGKNRISLVEVAGELLVLGVGENQINLLTKLENPRRVQGRGDDPAGQAENRREPFVQVSTGAPSEPDDTDDVVRDFSSELSPEIEKYRRNAELHGSEEKADGLEESVEWEDRSEEKPGAIDAIREKIATMKKL